MASSDASDLENALQRMLVEMTKQMKELQESAKAEILAAIASSQKDAHSIMQMTKKAKSEGSDALCFDADDDRKRGLVEELEGLFQELDDVEQSDESPEGYFTSKDLKQFLEDPRMCRQLGLLGINTFDAESLFKLLNTSDDGLVDMKTFVDACHVMSDRRDKSNSTRRKGGRLAQRKQKQVPAGTSKVDRQAGAWSDSPKKLPAHAPKVELVDVEEPPALPGLCFDVPTDDDASAGAWKNRASDTSMVPVGLRSTIGTIPPVMEPILSCQTDASQAKSRMSTEKMFARFSVARFNRSSVATSEDDRVIQGNGHVPARISAYFRDTGGDAKTLHEKLGKTMKTMKTKMQFEDEGPNARVKMMKKVGTKMRLILNRPEEEADTMFEAIVKHPAFDLGSALLILISTALIGIETDHQARNSGESSKACENIGYVMCFFFTVELLLRILASGRGFLCNQDKLWNRFDSIMVVSGIAEVIIQVSNAGSGSNASGGRVLRILRIVRIVRALRIGRVVKHAHTFKQIAYALQASMSTLFWALIMIFLVMYCFAIALCQATTFHIIELADEPDYTLENEAGYVSTLKNRYSNVPESITTLFKSITGGMNWGDVYEPISMFSAFYGCLFISFIGLVFFGVLNIVTAIFVDSAMQSQQHYKDLLIQDKLQTKEMYTKHLKEVFQRIDSNRTGYVTMEEVEFFLQDVQLRNHLDSIDIFPHDARSLFQMLDDDESGRVNIDEFCDGCLRLKGEAKAYDIHCLLLMTKSIGKRMLVHEEKVLHKLKVLGAALGLGWNEPVQAFGTCELDATVEFDDSQSDDGTPQAEQPVTPSGPGKKSTLAVMPTFEGTAHKISHRSTCQVMANLANYGDSTPNEDNVVVQSSSR